MTGEADRTTPDGTADQPAGPATPQPTPPVLLRTVTVRPAGLRRATAMPSAQALTAPEQVVLRPPQPPATGPVTPSSPQPEPTVSAVLSEARTDGGAGTGAGADREADDRACEVDAVRDRPRVVREKRDRPLRTAAEGAASASRRSGRVARLMRDRRVVWATSAATALLLAGVPSLATNGPTGAYRTPAMPAAVPAGGLPLVPDYPLVPGFASPSADASASAAAPPTTGTPASDVTSPPSRNGVAPTTGTPGGMSKGSAGGAAVGQGTGTVPRRTAPAPAPTTAPAPAPTTAPAPVRTTAPAPAPTTAPAPAPTTAPAPAPTTAAAPAPASGPDYDAITGLGCIRNDTQGYYTQGQGLSGWRTGSSGGFGGYGCSGRYESMPLNGSNSHTDNRYMVWWFDTTKVSSARCDLWIFVPAAADSADTSSTAYFAVIPDKSSGKTLGTFTVNESATRNSWAYGGKWTMSGGKLAVKLLDRGSGRASAAAALVKCYR